MIAPMRRWLLVIMLLLLPLRGVVGDAMAGQMLQHGAAAAATAEGGHARHGREHDHAAHAAAHDCDQHRDAGAAAENAEAAPSDCPTCAGCQACSSVALAMNFEPPPPVAFTQPRPQTVTSVHPSADQPHAFKPPRR